MNGLAAPACLKLWHARLDVDPRTEAALGALLSADERARAGRFRFERHRRRYVAARGILRSLLGAQLRVDPRRLAFTYGRRGRPSLAGGFDEDALDFNVAHSSDHGLFAIANRGVGVDIEAIRAVPDAASLAERYFSRRENLAIRALPEPLRETAFLLCWTRKEAYVKGLGEGLAHPLDRFDVGVAAGQAPGLVQVIDEGRGQVWHLHDVSRLPDYAAAVACDGPLETLQIEAWRGL